MSGSTRRGLAVCAGLLLICAPLHAQSERPDRTPGPPIAVAGRVDLASLVALSDAYLQKFADTFTLFASSAEARSALGEVVGNGGAATSLRKN